MLSGLAKQHAILGMDFVREQQLCIEADHMFFKKFPLKESVSCSTLTAPEDFSVSTRTTALRTELFVRTARETLLLPGTSGASSITWDGRHLWEGRFCGWEHKRRGSVPQERLSCGLFYSNRR